jgi:5-methylthioadenosine/S-adenosylhomocysteine deaminase
MCDFIIKNGVVITMGPERQILEDGALAVQGDRIVAVGHTNEILMSYHATREIDARRMVVMPGLIDGHAHAGHALVKSLGANLPDGWNNACTQIYQFGSDEEFWFADGQLSALERLKCGTTTSVTFLGGGDNIMRTDDALYGSAHCEATLKVGIREILAVGPGRPPYPKTFVLWDKGSRREALITFERQLEVSEELIQRWHQQKGTNISICVALPTYNPAVRFSVSELMDIKGMATDTRSLSKKYKVLFVMDGHSKGTILFSHTELDLLGPDAIFAHSIDMTSEEIDLCRQTNSRIVHNPSAIFSIMGRCPVPELIDAGVTVFLGSDGVGPDRSYDMFRHMFQCMHYHRTYFHDPDILPAGKVLEMVTIDAARGLGMENEIGSLEAGKKADIILVDMAKPHLCPLNMTAYRIAHYANGADVDTVIVNGKILMENRQVKSVSESETLVLAQTAFDKAVDRTQLHSLMKMPDHFWGHSKF